MKEQKELGFVESVWPNLAASLIELSFNRLYSNLAKNARIAKILSKYKIYKLDSTSFDSIYIYSLLSLDEIWAKKMHIKIFFSKEVRALYHSAHQNNIKSLDQILKNKSTFGEMLKACLLQNTQLWRYEIPEVTLFSIGELVWDSYNEILVKAMDPIQCENFNTMNEMARQIADLYEENLKNTFEYQIEDYLKNATKRFNENFIDKKRYIPINGEIRDYYSESNFEEHRSNDQPLFHADNLEPIDEFIFDWIHNSVENLLVIVGEYGTGKTTYCKYLEYVIAKRYLESSSRDRNNIHNRIPLFFPLREYSGSLDYYIRNQIGRNSLNSLRLEDFYNKNEEGEFLILLDGLDEMAQEIVSSEKRTNFQILFDLVKNNKNAKVIITVREEYFISPRERWEVFNISSEKDLPIVHLHSFNDSQIWQFLSSHNINAEQTWEKIHQIPGLMDVATRPVLLQIIIDHLEKVLSKKSREEPIKAIDLYEEAIKAELDRKQREINLKIPQIARLEILEKLSAWMFVKNTLSFKVPLLEEELELKKYFNQYRDWEYQKILNDFLPFSFQLNEGHERFRISHKSFRDYLAAKKFFKELNSGELDYFSKIQTTKEVNDFIRELKPNTNKLIDYVKQSHSVNNRNPYQGTNAANILVRINPEILSGENLEGAELRNVDFLYTDLTNSNLSHANLSGARINKSIFKANLNNTELRDAKLYPIHKEADSWEEAEELLSFELLYIQEKFNIQEFTSWPWEELNGLRELYLFNTNILDFKGAKSIESLETISLRYSDLATLIDMPVFPKLKTLDLGNSSLKAIKGIPSFSSLSILNLNSTDINDLATLPKLDNLKELYASDIPLTTLEGFPNLMNLEILDLSKTLLSSLKGLPNLPKLKSLKIGGDILRKFKYQDSGQKLKSLEGFPDFKNLEILDVSWNEIESIEHLPEQLLHIKEINLSHTRLADMRSLPQMPTLKVLNISGSEISSLESSTVFPSLETLEAIDTKLINLQGVNSYPALKKIDLGSSKIESLNGLIELPELEILNLANNPIESLLGIVSLPKLRYLNLNRSKLNSIEKLPHFPSLATLSLDETLVESFHGMPKLNQLKTLSLRKTLISSLFDFPLMENLKKLDLTSTKLVGFQHFPKLPKLRELALVNTPIETFESLPNLESLEMLLLGGTRITSLNDIPYLPNLKSIDVSDTAISEITNLANLRHLIGLDISDTNISNLDFIHELPNLQKLIVTEENFGGEEIQKLQSNSRKLTIEFM